MAPAACRRALVTASRAMRCTDAITSAGSRLALESIDTRTGSSPRRGSSAMARRSWIVADGVMSASVDSSRSAPTSMRMALIASPPACSIVLSARTATSGRSCATRLAAWACTTMPVTWWATMSCSSRAMAMRSSWRTWRELASWRWSSMRR